MPRDLPEYSRLGACSGASGLGTHFSDLQAQEKEIEGVLVRVATPRTLYRMKRDTVRPIDKADAMALRSAFNLGEDD